MDDGRGWINSPIENKDDKLSMSASDVYRELPYHLPRRVSQDGVPLVLASFDDSAVAVSPANEDDETQLQVSTDSGWDKTQKLESVEPPRVDEVSDTETHIFSDDDDDMELTQIIADDDIDDDTEAPREAQLCRPPRVGDAEDVGRGEATMRLLSPPPSAPFKRTAVHSESVHTYEPTQRLMEPPSASNETGASAAPNNQDPHSSTTSIASSTTTMAHDASAGDVDHESSSVVHHQFLQHGASKPCDTVTSETRQSPRSHAMVIGAQPNDNQPQPAGIECPIEIPPRSSSSILSSTAAGEASAPESDESMSTAVDDPPPPAVYLQRRTKDADAPLIHSSRPPPVVASTFDFDNNDSASQTSRPFAFLDQSQSQQDTQASLPDLNGLAATTLDAAMHVQGYTSHLTRQIMDDNNDDYKNVFATPPKPPRRLRSSTMISTPTTTTSSSPPTCSRRLKKRKMPTPDQPSPVPPRSAYATRVKCFADVHFYLSGFKEVASGQLVSQITSYGGKILKDIAQMKKVQDRCYVVATAEASRRPKTLYAMACGIPIVHPDWLAACFQSRVLVDVTGYWIPSGFSWITRRSLVHIPQHQHTLFTGLRFGIPNDVPNKQRKEYQRSIANVMKFPLEHCGAVSVKMNVTRKAIEEGSVDVLLTNEFTPLCTLAQEYDIPVVRFLWVNECLIHQKLVDTSEPNLVPDEYDDRNGTLNSRVMEVILPTASKLRLCLGEMVFVDLDNRPHDLLYHICQVVRLDQADDGAVSIQVQVYRRNVQGGRERGQELSPTRQLVKIQPTQVMRKASLVALEDFTRLAYNDSSLFYMRNDS